LYIIYINDLPLNVNVDSKLLLFADVTSVLIIANNLQDLQTNPTSILNQMNKWSVVNGLSLNIEKTNVIPSNEIIFKIAHFKSLIKIWK